VAVTSRTAEIDFARYGCGKSLHPSSERVTEIPGESEEGTSRIKPWPKLNGPVVKSL
jgi:hypothetical protein